jgi:hypothetical protein
VGRAQGLVVGVTITGVGTPAVGVGEGVGLPRGVEVKNTRVGEGVGLLEPRKVEGPNRLRTKLNTMTMLKMVVKILTLRLLRRLYLDRPTLPS